MCLLLLLPVQKHSCTFYPLGPSLASYPSHGPGSYTIGKSSSRAIGWWVGVPGSPRGPRVPGAPSVCAQSITNLPHFLPLFFENAVTLPTRIRGPRAAQIWNLHSLAFNLSPHPAPRAFQQRFSTFSISMCPSNYDLTPLHPEKPNVLPFGQ